MLPHVVVELSPVVLQGDMQCATCAHRILLQPHAYIAGYMACICYGLFLMLGVVGWRSSLLFTRHIYKVRASVARQA
jgi:hypothetical protein